MDTPRGLLVPVIRDVDRKSVTEISVELGAMAERTRTGKVDLADLEGGTFTVSNLGGLGGTAFTPIINAPEVAILGAARSRTEPVYVDGDLQPRLILPLSLSYDHRPDRRRRRGPLPALPLPGPGEPLLPRLRGLTRWPSAPRSP